MLPHCPLASMVFCEECLQSSTRQFLTLPLFLVVQTLKVNQKWELRAFLLSFICRCTAWECVVKVSVISDSLWPLGLYSPWNSPGQNTAVGSHSFFQQIFPTQESNRVSCIVGGFFTNWAVGEARASVWPSSFPERCLSFSVCLFPKASFPWLAF